MTTRFRFEITARALGLSATLFLLAYLIVKQGYLFSPVILVLFAAYQVYSLIRIVESSSQHFTRFLTSIQQSDFSQAPLSAKWNSSFSELKSAYDTIIEPLRESRADAQEKSLYLQMTLQHVRIGLLSYDQNGTIVSYNNTARKYLQFNQLQTIEDIKQIDVKLYRAISEPELQPTSIVKIERGGEYLQLTLSFSKIHFGDQTHTLVSLNNIQNELDDKEMEAWHNLIRTLTHEIMNSVTPISSLASTADSLLKESLLQKNDTSGDRLSKASLAVETIQRRSASLLSFVENYRKLSRIPNPDFKKASLSDLFERIQILMRDQLKESAVELRIEQKDPSEKLVCDASQIEQILINLIRNAIQATQKQSCSQLVLRSYQSNIGRIVIELEDNGSGIESDALDKIFIPFFTTKPEGLGIGLSISRQIMHLHNGSLKAYSKPGGPTRFVLTF